MLVFILHILGYDIWFYLSHLLLHTQWMYKNVHRFHHEISVPKYKDTYHGHWFEGPFQSIGFLLPFMLGYELRYIEFIIGLVMVNLRGMIRHENRLRKIFGNHHLTHHLIPNCNYGEYWLDCLFNTNHKKKSDCIRGILRTYF